MNFLSLFSGIGGIDLGLERAGMKCVAQVEICSFCRRVLAKHWPNVPRFEDVRTVTRETLAGLDIDCIAGGFPCQDISKAGNVQGSRTGINGKRSGLWREFHRLICEIRPRFAIVENVTKLLDRGAGRILGDLAEVGYDAEWGCVPAAAFNACHIRDRLLLCAYPNGERIRLFGRAANVSPPRTLQGKTRERNRIWADLRSIREGAAARARLADQWCGEPDALRTGNGVSGWVDRRKSLGNAVYPDVAEWIGRRIMEAAAESEAA